MFSFIKYASVDIGEEPREFEIEFSFDYVDSGIGPYEYWGATGVHHDWGFEDFGIESAKEIVDNKQVSVSKEVMQVLRQWALDNDFHLKDEILRKSNEWR